MPADRPWSPWHDRLHRTLLQAPELLPDGSKLLLAVSGGQDSMALLALLQDLAPLHHWALMVWHGDHGWHDGSAAVARDLGLWCSNRGLPVQIERAEPGRTGSEANARAWRYGTLQRLAAQQQRDVVTGHTGSDRAETLLLHLARGTDLNGLSSLRSSRPLQHNNPEGPWLRRPLLGFSRSDTLALCGALKLPVWVDPSNSNPAFARNRIRHEVLPVLEAMHPGSSARMAALAERLSQVRDTQRELARLGLESLAFDRPSDSGTLSRRRIGRLDSGTRRVLLAAWLAEQGAPAQDAALLEQLSRRLTAGAAGGACHLAGGWQLSWQGDVLTLKPPAAER